MTIRAASLLALVVLTPLPATAQQDLAQEGALERIFPTTGICYARTYSAEHLSSHPKQNVKRVTLKVAENYVVTGGGSRTPIQLSFTLALPRQSYESYAECLRESPARCILEGDAGAVLLTPLADGGVEMRVHSKDGIEFEGDVTVGAPQSDDKVFRLARAAASACKR